MQSWITNELASSDLGDARLDRRFQIVLDRLSQRPTLSLPAACEGWGETQAAYRFLDNDRVEPDKLLAPHRQATLQRIASETVVLIGQDTTELELTRKKERVGGPLRDDEHYGLYVHPLLAVTPEGVPLGVLNADIWWRNVEDFHKRLQRRNKPIEAKESYRWLTGYKMACAVAEQSADTQVICLSDSEGDIYECYAAAAEARGRKADWIVRACQDRRLQDPAGEKLYAAAKNAAVKLRLTIEVSAREAQCGDGSRRRQARRQRKATVTVHATTVTLKAPERPRGEHLPPVTVNVVLVREQKPPAGEEPVEWLLLTSLPIRSEGEVQRVVAHYCRRWDIEVFFRVLKSGCRVEELQLETSERMAACVALYLIVAWRVIFVLRLGRECPDLPCEAVLSPDEWRSVYTIVKNEPPPVAPPSLGEMIPLIASLGGYLQRKNDEPPGPKAMWIGMQRMRDFAVAWASFGPQRSTRKCV